VNKFLIKKIVVFSNIVLNHLDFYIKNQDGSKRIVRAVIVTGSHRSYVLAKNFEYETVSK